MIRKLRILLVHEGRQHVQVLSVDAEVGLFFLMNILRENWQPHLLRAKKNIFQIGFSKFFLDFKLVWPLHLALA